MSGPKRKIDPDGTGVIVTVRLSSDIIELLDLLVDNRSRFIRAATSEKIERELNEREKKPESGQT